ncbi:hypothetical protein ABZS61_12115 [Streptomyces sp. NPDC005566]|uniref:hypothetical protein n=1 Tax=Streptomyces sp. NPDC005566 TaxID=3156886 RepID=UPI0033BB5E7A
MRDRTAGPPVVRSLRRAACVRKSAVSDNTTYERIGCSGIAAPGDNWTYGTSCTVVTAVRGAAVPAILYSP